MVYCSRATHLWFAHPETRAAGWCSWFAVRIVRKVKWVAVLEGSRRRCSEPTPYPFRQIGADGIQTATGHRPGRELTSEAARSWAPGRSPRSNRGRGVWDRAAIDCGKRGTQMSEPNDDDAGFLESLLDQRHWEEREEVFDS